MQPFKSCYAFGMKTPQKHSYAHIFGAIVLGFICFSLGMISQKGMSKNAVVDSAPTREETGRSEDLRTKDYFVSDILPLYPQLSDDFTPESILKVKSFYLKGQQQQGWILSSESSQGQTEIYLITPGVQKKLDQPMTDWSGNDAVCNLNDIVFVGNESSLSRDLADKFGYGILSGSECEAYGGGQFTSIYALSTGEKVKFSGNIPLTSPNRSGVSSVGNAQGKLQAVYGVNTPTVVVEFGTFEGAITSLETVDKTAFFDLQTGRLKQVVEYK
jgi:hypothetical protein